MTNRTWEEILSPQKVIPFVKDFIETAGIAAGIIIFIMVAIVIIGWVIERKDNAR